MKLRLMLGIVLLVLIGLLAACGGTSANNAHQVTVTLSDFHIQSDATSFTPETTYHFVVTNTGHTNHELMIMSSMSGQMPMGQMDRMALYHIDASQLPAGASKSFDYTFPQTATQQSLEFACHLPGHYEAGMHLPMAVK